MPSAKPMCCRALTSTVLECSLRWPLQQQGLSTANETGPVPGATDRGAEEPSLALNKGLGLMEEQIVNTSPSRGLQRVPGVNEKPVRGSYSERLARLCKEVTFNF